MSGRSWELVREARPLPMNAYRRLHFRARAALDLEWRQAFGWLAREAKVPRLDAVTITVGQVCRRPPLPDVGASFPIAKAAIDGLVDARVLDDDTPDRLLALTFTAPTRGPVDLFALTVTEYQLTGVPAQ